MLAGGVRGNWELGRVEVYRVEARALCCVCLDWGDTPYFDIDILEN